MENPSNPGSPEKKESSKEEILQKVNRGLDILKNIKEEDQTERQKWIIRSMEESLSRADDNGEFEVGPENGPKQKEGIPVDDLMEELSSISSGLEDKPGEKAILDDIRKTLNDNSVGYFEKRPGMTGDKQHWRTEYEAYLSSKDHRNSGNADEDYAAAMEAMKKRRELVFDKSSSGNEKQTDNKFDPKTDSAWTDEEKAAFDRDFEEGVKKKKDEADTEKAAKEARAAEAANEGLVDDPEAAAMGGSDRNAPEAGTGEKETSDPHPDLVDDPEAAATGGFDRNAPEAEAGEKTSDDPRPDLVDDPEAAALGGFDRGGDGKKEPKKIKYEEEDREINELASKVDEARRAYVIKQNQFNEKSSLMRKVLGIGNGPQLKEFNDEFEAARKNYEEALKNYKDKVFSSVIEDAEGVGILTSYFNEEHLKIAETRDQVRMENNSWPNAIKDGYMRMLDGYRNLPMSKKLMIGGSLGVVGLASGAWAGAGVAMGVMAARRAFSMSVSSLGFASMFEGIADKSREKRNNEEIEDVSRGMKNENGEFDAESAKEFLDGKIGNINDEIVSRDRAKRWRTYGAIGAGVATSFLGSWVGRNAADWGRGAVGFVSDKSEDVMNSDVIRTASEYWKGKMDGIFDASLGESGGLEGPGTGGENMAEAVVDMTDATATAAQEIGYQGGKSVWAEAENQLGVRMKEAFENLGGGDPKVAEALQTYNTDRLKDMIVADPAKYGLPADIDFNKMSVDQLKSIEWDKAFTDVFGASELTEDLTPEQVESIVGNNAALREALQESMKMPGAESLVENAASTEAYDEFVKDWEGRIQGVIGESQEIYDQYPEFKSLSSVDQINGKIISLQDQINDMKVGATPEDRAMIGEQMQKLAHLKELRANYEELYYKAFYSFTDYGNIDRSLLDADAGEYVKDHGQDKMVKIFESLKSTMSPEQVKELKLEPQSGEKTIEWSRRVTTYIMKNMAQK